MPTFIDESGETGHHSPHFRLAAVWLPTQADVETYRTSIRKFQSRARLTGYEFKFSKTRRKERRAAFFQVAMEHPFRFAVASVDKTHPEWRMAGAAIVHWACAVSLASSLRPLYLEEERRRVESTGEMQSLNELVVVDDNQDRNYLAVVKKKFRELRSEARVGSPLIGKVKFRGSGPEELIQLADMVCGAVGAHLDGESTWYKMISAKEIGITLIP